MQTPRENPAGILVVDDEPKSLRSFERAFGRDFPVHTAGSPEEALRILTAEGSTIGVIVSDQRMPVQTGVELLEKVRALYPDKVRLLTTAFTEVDTLVEAINRGSVYGFVSKPWDLAALRRDLQQAMGQYENVQKRRDLLASRLEDLRDAVLEEKASEIGSIAVNLSHYVDNALCPVEILISKLDSDLRSEGLQAMTGRDRDAYLAFLGRMRGHIRSTTAAIAHLRNVNAPLDERRIVPVDPCQCFRDSITRNAELRERKNIRFELDCGGVPLSVLGDRERLDDFFQFLIAEEVVSLPRDSEVRVWMRADEEKEGIRITLSDDGPIHRGNQPSDLLFPFNVRSGNPREFGVFLICAYFIVRSHGGTMAARTRSPSGLILDFRLPSRPSVEVAREADLASFGAFPHSSNAVD